MIKSKQDLNEYLLADGKNYPYQSGGGDKSVDLQKDRHAYKRSVVYMEICKGASYGRVSS